MTLVISSWKSVWYILRCVEMVRNMYILWDMVFVICIRIICRYFVGHGSYIYIYIYTLRDMKFKDVWEVCMGILWGMCFVKWMEVWDR